MKFVSTTCVLLLLYLVVCESLAPYYRSKTGRVIDGQYIVVMHSNTTRAARDAHIQALRERFRLRGSDESIFHAFALGNLIGFGARLTQSTFREQLRDPKVRYIEYDQEVRANGDTKSDPALNQTEAVWGLSRIDQRNLPTDVQYQYFSSAGSGVYAYVVDTGIELSHPEFNGRAILGSNFVTAEEFTDCNGHGTHVSGTIGGVTYGVAKNVTLVAVKVLGCDGSGSNSGVIAGVDWVTANHTARGAGALSVINMSLGGSTSPTLDSAVANAHNANVSVVVAAGNDNARACRSSPARAAEAITVAASDMTDTRASFSNYGSCVDIFAPGTNITSSYMGGTTKMLRGTSMASPHVAGTVAVRMGHLAALGLPSASSSEHTSWLIEVSTKDVIIDPKSSPNRLVYSPFTDTKK